MVIKMLNELRRMDSENFSEEIENTRMYQTAVTEMRNTIIKLKNTLEGFSSRLDETKREFTYVNFCQAK